MDIDRRLAWDIQFERSEDYATIRQLLTEPACFRRMANDAAPAPEELPVGPVSGIDYVLANEGDKPVALFLIISTASYPPAMAEVHFTFLPEAWGRSVAVAREFLEWVWAHTSLNWLIGPVPSYNRTALKVARSVGFEELCVHRNAGTKHGKSFDLIIHEARRGRAAEKDAA